MIISDLFGSKDICSVCGQTPCNCTHITENNNKPEPPEADYGADYQAMVGRVRKLAGLGPLKTVYDPKKRVYRNVPRAEQPTK